MENNTIKQMSPLDQVKKWLWPFLVVFVIGAFVLRIYFQRNASVLNGRMAEADLIAEASTAAGQKTLERMIRSLANPEETVKNRALRTFRNALPEKLQSADDAFLEEGELMNALLVLEKLPPEFKIRFTPLFIQMLDHPQNAALAVQELEDIARVDTNVVMMLLDGMQGRMRGGGTVTGTTKMRLALQLAPEDPRVFGVLAEWITNGISDPLVRLTGIELIIQHFPSHPDTSQLLAVAATDPDPAVSGRAAAVLSNLRRRTSIIPSEDEKAAGESRGSR